MKLYLQRLFVGTDQLLNVIFYPLLNLLLSDGSYLFGHPDETLSGVMGKNVRAGKCRGCYFICRYILHPIDKGHCEKAIEDETNAGTK